MNNQNVDILALAKQMKALAKAATPGPWNVGPHLSHGISVMCAPDVSVARSMTDEDSRFTSEARTAVPQLADAVLNLSAEVAALKELLKFAVERFSNVHLANCGEQITGPNDCFCGTEDWESLARDLLTKLGIDSSTNQTEGE